jgi:hypothetical protein
MTPTSPPRRSIALTGALPGVLRPWLALSIVRPGALAGTVCAEAVRRLARR